MGEGPEALLAARLVQNFLRLHIAWLKCLGRPLNEHQRALVEASDVEGSTVETDVKVFWKHGITAVSSLLRMDVWALAQNIWAYVDGIMHSEFFNNRESQYETIKIN
jgi:hypothetical protein